MASGSHYSDLQRRDAVIAYLLHGNWRKVAEVTGIPQRTLNDWSTQTWYGTLLAEVREEKGAELDGAYTRIIHEATEQLMDRLKHGDPYIAGGEVRRKPVTARDLAIVAGVVHDKRALARSHAPLPMSDELKYTMQDLQEWLESKALASQRGRGKSTEREDVCIRASDIATISKGRRNIFLARGAGGASRRRDGYLYC